ncbi:hypothetical protein D3C73_1399760 [compost metagenome]
MNRKLFVVSARQALTPIFSRMGGSGMTRVGSCPGFHKAVSMSDEGEGEWPFSAFMAHQ